MCGILYAKLKSNTIDKEKFQVNFSESLDKMKYRGPDSTGIVNLNNHFFGHVRLSIIDLKASSDQPFQDKDNLMVFNGEIYNYKELEPDSTSDTQTLFNLMKKKDLSFTKIRGFFTLAWFNKHTEEVSFYRDFYGEKPLYYYYDSEIEIVSSTLKSIKYLLNSIGKKVEVNIEAIKEEYMLFGYIREPQTIWNKVFTVPPGHKLIFTKEKAEVIPLEFQIKNASFPWKQSKYIENSLLSTDVPGTLLLSSGIDSTYLLSEAIEHKIPLQIGIYKANNKLIDESEDALVNIGKLSVDKEKYPIKILSSEKEKALKLDEFCSLLEQPSSDGLQLFSLLSHLKKSTPSLKLVYTGLGGDELFGGYNSFSNYSKIKALLKIPFIEKLMPKMERFVFGYKQIGFFNVDVYSFLYRFDYYTFKNLFEDKSTVKKLYENYMNSFKWVPNEIDLSTKDVGKAIKKHESYQYCLNQLLRDNDNISMYLGLESRSPLLSPDWYNQKTDGKNRFVDYLNTTFGITFGQKKGFTLDDSNTRDLYGEFVEKNKIVLSQVKLDFFIKNIEKLSTLQLKKIALLVGWLKYNTD